MARWTHRQTAEPGRFRSSACPHRFREFPDRHGESGAKLDADRTLADNMLTWRMPHFLLHQVVAEVPPLDGDVPTVWCAQHDPVTYEPRGARSYELPSKSGNEPVGVVTFLLTQPQTSDVDAAVRAAIAWYRSADVKLEDTHYVSRPSGSTDDNYNPIQPSPGDTMWCRFYDLDQDRCFFSGRLATDNPPGNGKQYDIMGIEPERRYGYQWGGAYGTKLFAYTDSLGY